jgi:hypothetical protein
LLGYKEDDHCLYGKWFTYYLAYSNRLKADALILLGCQDTMINLVAKEPKSYLTVKVKVVDNWIHGFSTRLTPSILPLSLVRLGDDLLQTNPSPHLLKFGLAQRLGEDISKLISSGNMLSLDASIF